MMNKNDLIEKAIVKSTIDVVNNLLANFKSFTRWDVIKLVRHEMQEHVEADEIRTVIDWLWDNGNGFISDANYKLSMHKSLMIFHPYWRYAFLYDKNDNTPKNSVVTSTVNTTAAKAKAKNSTRLTIPRKVLRSFGVKRGSNLFVAKRNNNQPGLVLLKNPPSSGLLATYHVGNRGDVRLSSRVLENASLGDSPRISLSDRAIVVTPTK